jgi:hypothetical protein
MKIELKCGNINKFFFHTRNMKRQRSNSLCEDHAANDNKKYTLSQEEERELNLLQSTGGNTDVMCYLFSFCTLEDMQLNMRLVSKRWNELSLFPQSIDAKNSWLYTASHQGGSPVYYKRANNSEETMNDCMESTISPRFPFKNIFFDNEGVLLCSNYCNRDSPCMIDNEIFEQFDHQIMDRQTFDWIFYSIKRWNRVIITSEVFTFHVCTWSCNFVFLVKSLKPEQRTIQIAAKPCMLPQFLHKSDHDLHFNALYNYSTDEKQQWLDQHQDEYILYGTFN